MNEDQIIHSRRYRFLLQKTYFERGNSLMSVLKYVFLVPLLSSYEEGLLSILAYGLVAWILGRLWYSRKFGTSLQEIESEIGNQFNKFQQELRVFSKKKSNR